MERFRRAAPLHTCQPPYNIFERGIEADVLPYCLKREITVLAYGPICRGLLSGRMRADTAFPGDDLRKMDPKFKPPRYGRYLEAVERLDQFARKRYGKRVIHLALRWVLDRTETGCALWGARRPGQLDPIDQVVDWSLDGEALAEIHRIVREIVVDPVGPEFMAPSPRAPESQ
jgi:aryl-alcohol dehydrogenase-like predicted oxidoreductase